MNFDQFLQSNKREHVWCMLEYWTAQHPHTVALIDYRTEAMNSLTFSELYTKACGIVTTLIELGATSQTQALIFLRPSLNFHPLIFALFRLQISPIFIDPSMPRGEFLKAEFLLALQQHLLEMEGSISSLQSKYCGAVS